MNEWTIGQVARHFEVSPSTLRYYEDRGFVHPRRTSAGARTYGREQLRRIAFLRLGGNLGIALDTVATVLDAPRSEWQQVVQAEQFQAQKRISEANNALALLEATSTCPHHHPGRDCPDLRGALDKIIDGVHIDDLAKHYT